MKPETSIIILCHNDVAYLRRCAASIRRHTRGSYELIFVDNASSDGAIDHLRKIRRSFPCPVKIIRNKSNRYFAGGNNQGLRVARGDYVVLLNADTIVTPDWLGGLVRCARNDPKIGLVGPYTNHAAGLQVLWPPAYRNISQLPKWSRQWARTHRHGVRAVPWLIGFCLLITRQTLEDIGNLDELFGPGGFEDYDYCLRARLAGYKNVIAEDVYIHHFGGRGYVNMRYDELRNRNRKIYWNKWTKWTSGRWSGKAASPRPEALRSG